jgi:signal transduction histidine kinase
MRLLRKYWLEVGWGLFAAANIAAMFVLENWETIPFHFVWVSLALLYCVRPWKVAATLTVLAIVSITTGVALASVVIDTGAGYDELTEVPLMASMYLVIVWHARRWQQATDARRRSVERERDFVRDASHALRTPITVALGHAELARSAENGQRAGDIDIVIDELKRVATISDRLLLLASANAPHFLERKRVDVGHLVRTCAKRWTGTAPRDWRVNVSANGTIVGDEERLALALDCLVENASKATDQGDTISLACRAAGEIVWLEVSDSGVGIAQVEQCRVFERFSRANGSAGNGSAARSNGGTGLGLSIVKAIAEAHSGTVELESELGRGSTFRIRLNGFRPAALEPPESTRSPTLAVGEVEDLLARDSHPVGA